ncbi:hypothetical protein L484_025541 [Morus notabilis]|uniref:Uncharacterized protein n=1 Tax=Morus notabilis TaxID=981085 RepID=W9RP59_9ROSA|nr:hypothetical protein L484_025541 [Morus notabilis]
MKDTELYLGAEVSPVFLFAIDLTGILIFSSQNEPMTSGGTLGRRAGPYAGPSKVVFSGLGSGSLNLGTSPEPAVV